MKMLNLLKNVENYPFATEHLVYRPNKLNQSAFGEPGPQELPGEHTSKSVKNYLNINCNANTAPRHAVEAT